MPDIAAPQIQFGRIARTITYNDTHGALVFTFDFASDQPDGNGVWTIVLDSGAAFGREQITRLESPPPRQASWITSARSCVIDYLRARPYNVIDSEATSKA